MIMIMVSLGPGDGMGEGIIWMVKVLKINLGF